MARGVLIVGSAPTSPEVEAEFNRWYDDVHLSDILALQGFVSARRFRRVNVVGPSYLAIYEIEGDDLQAVIDGLYEARRRGEIPIPNFVDSDVHFESLHMQEISTHGT